MPPSYALNAEVGEIAMHIAFARRLPQEDPIVHFFDPEGGNITEVTVCTYEEPLPGLFSKITGAFFACGINIHHAQVFTRASRPEVAIDTFWVDFNGGQLEERHKERLQVTVGEVLSGKMAVEDVLRARHRLPPERVTLEMLKLNNQVSDDHTVVEIRAPDQTGLLFVMASALSKMGLDIHTAKITTWAGKAENAFYVTDDQGGKVGEEKVAEVEEQLTRIIRGSERSV
jgi:[protein-PII] uridylyltransferase